MPITTRVTHARIPTATRLTVEESPSFWLGNNESAFLKFVSTLFKFTECIRDCFR